MCAECHSTGVHKNYDAAKDRFATTWAEISVGCETCHGQGSAHVAWARDHAGWKASAADDDSKGLVVRFDERRNAAWTIDPATGNAARAAPPQTLRKEVETCGLCHARRGNDLRGLGSRPMAVRHACRFAARPWPLFRRRADGGRGLQLRLVQAEQDVRQRRDLQRLPRPAQFEAEAARRRRLPACHAPDKYAVAAHSRHDGVSPPVGCPDCHMPTRTYMVVRPAPRSQPAHSAPRPVGQARHAERLQRLPRRQDRAMGGRRRPELAWSGPQGLPALRRGVSRRLDRPGGRREACWPRPPSDHETPGFARAGALAELAPFLSAANVGLARASLADPDPMVRIGALDMLENAPPEQTLADRRAAARRSGPRRAREGGRPAGGGSRGRASPPATARRSTARRTNSSRRRSSTPTGPRRV